MEFSLKQIGILFPGYQTWATQSIPNFSIVRKGVLEWHGGWWVHLSRHVQAGETSGKEAHNLFAVNDSCHLDSGHIQLETLLNFRGKKQKVWNTVPAVSSLHLRASQMPAHVPSWSSAAALVLLTTPRSLLELRQILFSQELLGSIRPTRAQIKMKGKCGRTCNGLLFLPVRLLVQMPKNQRITGTHHPPLQNGTKMWFLFRCSQKPCASPP